MEISVRGYLTFRALVGARKVSHHQETLLLGDLLAGLAGEIGEDFSTAIYEPGGTRVRRQIAILVNGMHYTHLPHRLETPLKDGDEISIFPPVAGG